MSDILKKYLTEEELAAQLRVSTKTLKRWAIDKKGPPKTYIGRTVYYRTEAVLKWLEKIEGKDPQG